MPYKIVADIVVVVHFLWIVFLILGVFIGMRNRVVRILHASGLVFAVAIQLFGWYCPLTYLEVWLRAQHDPALSYAGSFIVHYLERLVYLELSRSVIFIGTAVLCGFTAWIYLRKKKI